MVLLHGAILTYALWVGESYAIGRVHYFIIGIIGIGALLACLKLIATAFRFGRKATIPVLGKPLSDSEAPALFEFVRNIAERIGARKPDNVVVGLTPNFFATSANVVPLGYSGVLSGETLYVSSCLARLFMKDEFRAVIAHELAHFKGDDTVYSLRFAPVYSGLAQALNAIGGEEEGATTLAALPANAILSFMFEQFSRNEKSIGRQRELEADRVGAEVSSNKSLSTALMKVALYSQLWPSVEDDNSARLNEGKVSGNLSKIFSDKVRFDVDHASIGEIVDEVLDQSIAHPTDTHPTIAARLESLGVDSSEIKKEDFGVPEESAISLIGDFENLEEELTIFQHKLLVALGRVRLPEDDELEQNYVLRTVYALAALMVAADGKILPEEIQTAEGIGSKLFDDFDDVDFREMCEAHRELPKASDLAEILSEVLSGDQKAAILKYLQSISEADADVAPEEQRLLEEVRVAFGP